jgi:hypothetical protein
MAREEILDSFVMIGRWVIHEFSLFAGQVHAQLWPAGGAGKNRPAIESAGKPISFSARERKLR